MSVPTTCDLLALQMDDHKIAYTREFRFDPARKWRFDFSIGTKIAVEVEGGTWVKGRHTRPQGYAKDAEKYNAAALDGWYVYRFTSEMVLSNQAIGTILKAVSR